MIVLVSGATKTNVAHWDDPRFGFLITPRIWGRVDAANLGKPWAADNDAFGGWTHNKSLLFTIMLNRFRHVDKTNLKFIACPDVVGCHASTLEKFEEWSEAVREHGPVGFVAQDGARHSRTTLARFANPSARRLIDRAIRQIASEAVSRPPNNGARHDRDDLPRAAQAA